MRSNHDRRWELYYLKTYKFPIKLLLVLITNIWIVRDVVLEKSPSSTYGKILMELWRKFCSKPEVKFTYMKDSHKSIVVLGKTIAQKMTDNEQSGFDVVVCDILCAFQS